VAAARAVAADDPAATVTSAALRVEPSNGTVTVHQYRTGARDTFPVSVDGAPDSETESAAVAARAPMSVTARVAVAPPLELTPSEMTERQRRVVERGVRRRLIAVAFGDGAVVSSEIGAADKLDAAVVEAVTALGRSGAKA
jgi:hypothetical protein